VIKHISYDILKKFTVSILTRCDVPVADAETVADCLLDANLAGVDSHGIVHLAHYVRRLANGTIKARPKIRYSRPRRAILRVDGDDGLGHAVTAHAIDRGIKVCRTEGSVVIVVANSSHFGTAAYHLQKITKANIVGMVTTHTDARIVPAGAKRTFAGTNPIAFGFPTSGESLILDMATSSVSFGKISLMLAEGRSVPADWGLDQDGETTTDPRKLVGLHPIAGHKGSGLAIVIDLLCSMFSGMPFGPHINRMFGDLEAPRKLGHFIALWDIGALVPIDKLKRRIDEYIAELHALPRKNPATPIYFPGELEALMRVERLASGIPIEPGLLRELVDLGNRLEVRVEGLGQSRDHTQAAAVPP
jgi:ureidoglycolate dehydrogenase (NAD+)